MAKRVFALLFVASMFFGLTRGILADDACLEYLKVTKREVLRVLDIIKKSAELGSVFGSSPFLTSPMRDFMDARSAVYNVHANVLELRHLGCKGPSLLLPQALGDAHFITTLGLETDNNIALQILEDMFTLAMDSVNDEIDTIAESIAELQPEAERPIAFDALTFRGGKGEHKIGEDTEILLPPGIYQFGERKTRVSQTLWLRDIIVNPSNCVREGEKFMQEIPFTLDVYHECYFFATVDAIGEGQWTLEITRLES